MRVIRCAALAVIAAALVAPAPAQAIWTPPQQVGPWWAQSSGTGSGIGLVALGEDHFVVKVNQFQWTSFKDRVDGAWGPELTLPHAFRNGDVPDSWLRANDHGTAAFLDYFPVSGVPRSLAVMTRAGGGPWGALENPRPAEHSNMQIMSRGGPLVDQAGNVTVFWANEEAVTSSIWSRTKPALSSAWLPAELVASGARWSPGVTTFLDDEGRMYALYFNADDTRRLAVRDPDTGAWSEAEPPRMGWWFKAVPGGRLLGLAHYGSNTSTLVALERDRDGAWTETELTPNLLNGPGYDLAVGPNGDAAAIWRQARTEAPNLESVWVARRPAGGSWQPAEMITEELNPWPTEQGGSSKHWLEPRVAVGPDGEVRAAWLRYENFNFSLRTRMRPADGPWGPTEDPARGQSAFDVEIAIDPAGTALLVWPGSGPQVYSSSSDGTVADYPPLTVAKTGTGAGTVSSAPPGIDCGSDCMERYPWGTTVTLTPTAAPGSHFVRWEGACAGSEVDGPPCELSMSEARSATAVFTLQRTPLPPGGGGGGGTGGGGTGGGGNTGGGNTGGGGAGLPAPGGGPAPGGQPASPFPAFTAFDLGLSGVSGYKAAATQQGRVTVPPASFPAYGFACAEACFGTVAGKVVPGPAGGASAARATAVKLKVREFTAAVGQAVTVKVTLPRKAVRLVKKRKRAKLTLITVINSGGKSAKLPATIRLKAKR